MQDYFMRMQALLNERYAQFASEGGLYQVSKSYLKYGLHRIGDKRFTYREWAPSAKALCLFGEFNGWKRGEHVCQRVLSS